MKSRQRQADEGDFLYSRQRTALASSGSMRSNLTDSGPDIVGIEPGDDLEVRVFTNHIEIWPMDPGDD